MARGTVAANRWTDRPLLQARLHGELASAASHPHVQGAPTVSEMYERSRIPRDYWFKPVKIEDETPKVDPEVSRDVAERMRAARNAGLSRTILSRFTGMTGSALWRAEHDRLHPDEVRPLQLLLDRLEHDHYVVTDEV